MPKTYRTFIPSGGKKIYVEFDYPKRLPAPAVIITHGLRSYFPGFLDRFAKRLREAGYITVKFHFVGTGRSSGKFEDKLPQVMLQNFRDVLALVKAQRDILDIGIIGRSDGGRMAVLMGPDPSVRAYVMLAPPAFLHLGMQKFVQTGTRRNGFIYHPSFKRPHTKGPGRLPQRYFDALLQADRHLPQQARRVKRVLFFQSVNDEASRLVEGHFDFWKKHLPAPRRLVLIPGSTHSFAGKKRFVIEESLKWFRRYLPIKKMSR